MIGVTFLSRIRHNPIYISQIAKAILYTQLEVNIFFFFLNYYYFDNFNPLTIIVIKSIGSLDPSIDLYMTVIWTDLYAVHDEGKTCFRFQKRYFLYVIRIANFTSLAY